MSLRHLLLASLDEPASGYEIKAFFDRTLRHFWFAHLSQIYPALQRLEDEGFLESETVSSQRGPDRRLYRRTESGRDELRRWLQREPEIPAARLPYMGQLCFMRELGDLRRTRAFLQRLRALFASKQATYVAIEGEWFRAAAIDPNDLPDELFHPYLTLRLGIARVESSVAWCDGALALVERRIRSHGDGVEEGSERIHPSAKGPGGI